MSDALMFAVIALLYHLCLKPANEQWQRPKKRKKLKLRGTGVEELLEGMKKDLEKYRAPTNT
jgi:hypothetical protein